MKKSLEKILTELCTKLYNMNERPVCVSCGDRMFYSGSENGVTVFGCKCGGTLRKSIARSDSFTS